MEEKKKQKLKDAIYKVFIAILSCLLALAAGALIGSIIANIFNHFYYKDSKNKESEIVEETIVEEEKIINEADPLGLSFDSYHYMLDNDLRKYLAESELGICSKMVKNIDSNGIDDYTFYYILKSNDKVVYICNYHYDRDIENKESIFTCYKGDGYKDFINGDTNMYRDYVMPEENNDMWINNDGYYERSFSLGKFSDMKCQMKGEDIYIDYYWYHNGEDGPVLIYEANAKNTKIISSKKYHQEIWDYYDESKDNIDIIAYDDFEREHDYIEECKQYKLQESLKRAQENLEEDIKTYCKCSSAEDLYDTYTYEFDESYEEALDFYDRYCR